MKGILGKESLDSKRAAEKADLERLGRYTLVNVGPIDYWPTRQAEIDRWNELNEVVFGNTQEDYDRFEKESAVFFVETTARAMTVLDEIAEFGTLKDMREFMTSAAKNGFDLGQPTSEDEFLMEVAKLAFEQLKAR